MAGIGRKFADAALLAAFMGGATIVDAAKEAGVSVQTASRRQRDPEFVARLEAAQRETFDATSRALGNATREAVSTLVQLLGDPKATVRLAAAGKILEFAPRWHGSQALEERIVALEQDLAEQKKKQG
jgi:BMFP domain-containing protein YqiC